MKKLFTAITMTAVAACATLGSAVPCFAAPENTKLTVGCKSAYMCNVGSASECIYSENETARMPIASVCKVMTLNLCFEAIDNGQLTFDDKVTVSERAAGMGGSQVFLQAGLTYTVSDLIKSIVVCSANDSCVAMSEKIGGSEEAFVKKMNDRAAEMGCNDTLFANCTGLPKETQYSCAKDVAIMFSKLIEHEDYFKYSKIWYEDFAHPDDRTISITNTNKLIKRYSACDGGKTGFTNQAGFCLASTAVKDNLRLVSVVLGADTSDNRFKSTTDMFEYGFANYKNKIVLDKDVNLNDKLAVKGGKKEDICVKPARNSYVFSAKDANPEITRNVVLFDVCAPVQKNDVVGKIEIYKNGIISDTVDVVAAENAEKSSFGDNFKKIARNWNL